MPSNLMSCSLLGTREFTSYLLSFLLFLKPFQLGLQVVGRWFSYLFSIFISFVAVCGTFKKNANTENLQKKCKM